MVMIPVVLILMVVLHGMAYCKTISEPGNSNQNPIICNSLNGGFVAYEGSPLEICPLRRDNITLKITLQAVNQGVSDSTEDDFKTYMTLLNSTQPCAIILTKDDLTPEPIEYFRITLTIVECPSILPVFCNAVIVDNDGLSRECRDIDVAIQTKDRTSTKSLCSPHLQLGWCTNEFSLACFSLNGSDISNFLALSESTTSQSIRSIIRSYGDCIRELQQSLHSYFGNLTYSDDTETSDFYYINCSATYTNSDNCSAFILYLERVAFRRIPNIRSNKFEICDGNLEIQCCFDSHLESPNPTTDSVTTVSIMRTTLPQPMQVTSDGAREGIALIGGVVGGVVGVTIIILTVLMIVLLACLTLTRKEKSTTSLNKTISHGQPVSNPEQVSYTDAGESSVVCRARYTSLAETEPPTLVAIKKLKDHYEIEKFISESELMLNLDHPNVLRLAGMCFNMADTPAAIILPYMGNGDLQKFLATKRETLKESKEKYPKDLSESVLLRMCMDIARGMHYLAKCKLVHRDMAARNCMVDNEMRVKVADFGLSRDVQVTDFYRLTHRQRLPVKWMAPESLFKNICSEKSDVWSYGIVCWEIFKLGKKPYSGIDNQDIPDYINHGFRLKKPSRCPSALYDDIMRKTWMEDPMERPNFEAVVKSLASLMKYDGNIDEDLKKEIANCVARNKYHQVEIPVVGGDNTDKRKIYSEMDEAIYSICSHKELANVPIEYEVPVLSSQKLPTPMDYEIPQPNMERKNGDKNREASSISPHHQPSLVACGNSPHRSPGHLSVQSTKAPQSESSIKHESQRRVSPESGKKLPPHSNLSLPNSMPTLEKSVMELNSDCCNANNHHYHTLEYSPSDQL